MHTGYDSPLICSEIGFKSRDDTKSRCYEQNNQGDGGLETLSNEQVMKAVGGGVDN